MPGNPVVKNKRLALHIWQPFATPAQVLRDSEARSVVGISQRNWDFSWGPSVACLSSALLPLWGNLFKTKEIYPAVLLISIQSGTIAVSSLCFKEEQDPHVQNQRSDWSGAHSALFFVAAAFSVVCSPPLSFWFPEKGQAGKATKHDQHRTF